MACGSGVSRKADIAEALSTRVIDAIAVDVRGRSTYGVRFTFGGVSRGRVEFSILLDGIVHSSP